MKINIVGGGPGGLYFALLMKKQDPSHHIVVYEQNPADATYGWGIVLSDRALSFLQSVDAGAYADLSAALETLHAPIPALRGERTAGQHASSAEQEEGQGWGPTWLRKGAGMTPGGSAWARAEQPCAPTFSSKTTVSETPPRLRKPATGITRTSPL